MPVMWSTDDMPLPMTAVGVAGGRRHASSGIFLVMAGFLTAWSKTETIQTLYENTLDCLLHFWSSPYSRIIAILLECCSILALGVLNMTASTIPSSSSSVIKKTRLPDLVGGV